MEVKRAAPFAFRVCKSEARASGWCEVLAERGWVAFVKARRGGLFEVRVARPAGGGSPRPLLVGSGFASERAAERRAAAWRRAGYKVRCSSYDAVGFPRSGGIVLASDSNGGEPLWQVELLGVA